MPNKTLENKIKLSPYFVAYLDILGTTDSINSEKSEEVLNNIRELYNDTMNLLKENAKNLYHIDVKYKIFSDNIVIAIPKELHTGLLDVETKSYYTMLFVSFIQLIALKYSFLIRGSIAVDDLYIDENFIYGKALTKTYKLESEVSVYPRIVINPKDIHLFTKSDTQREVIEKDNANIYYLNPFEFYKKYVSSQALETFMQIIKENLEHCLSENNNEKINQKICWFINMYNKFCNDNNLENCIINIEDYPYPYSKIETIISGRAGEFV